MGFLFLLHRETGEPIFPVKNGRCPSRMCPASKLAHTTFPHGIAIGATTLSSDDAWGSALWTGANAGN